MLGFELFGLPAVWFFSKVISWLSKPGASSDWFGEVVGKHPGLAYLSERLLYCNLYLYLIIRRNYTTKKRKSDRHAQFHLNAEFQF